MEIKRGTIKSFDSDAYMATIQIAGSLSVWLVDVPVARNIPVAEMVAGRTCAVILFDGSNPKDGVVVAVYG